MNGVVREVRQFMASRGGTGVVAVSGGADSVALLRALHDLGLPLVVAHVNYQLRCADSDADAAFVQDLCASLAVPCRVQSVDLAALAAGDNLEATARRIRYEFFSAVAAENGADWIATGHTADDQAETVLHRIIRGTGLQGLRGIVSGRAAGLTPAVLGDAETAGVYPAARPEIIRPLLGVTRADVVAYLAELNQPFREDLTNADPRFTRNRIRHELLPLLRTFNPDIVSALAHLAAHTADANEVIEAVAAEALARAERPRAATTIILDFAALGGSRAVIRSALRRLWKREGWPQSEMGFDAWDRAVSVATGELAACDFPGGITMRRAGRVVQIGLRE